MAFLKSESGGNDGPAGHLLALDRNYPILGDFHAATRFKRVTFADSPIVANPHIKKPVAICCTCVTAAAHISAPFGWMRRARRATRRIKRGPLSKRFPGLAQ